MSDEQVFVCPGNECRKKATGWGYTRDDRRNMYVCCVCFQPDARNWAITLDCIWCGEIFTLDVYSVKAMNNATCRNCGGTNYATEESAASGLRRRAEEIERWFGSRRKAGDLSAGSESPNPTTDSTDEAQSGNEISPPASDSGVELEGATGN